MPGRKNRWWMPRIANYSNYSSVDAGQALAGWLNWDIYVYAVARICSGGGFTYLGSTATGRQERTTIMGPSCGTNGTSLSEPVLYDPDAFRVIRRLSCAGLCWFQDADQTQFCHLYHCLQAFGI
eukprot:5715035-Amphidinium_carterae.2